MKFLIFLAAWKRPEITEVCFMGIDRLKRSFPIDTLCVISEESMKPLCKKYSIDYVEYKNQPLGEKKNFGLSKTLEKSWDYLVEIGSDDVLKDFLFEEYSKQEREVMAVNNFCYLNSETGECRNMVSNTFYGIGRAIRRDVLEKVPKLWSDTQNRGMDNHSNALMVMNGIRLKQLKFKDPVGIDIKSKENIWPFTDCGQPYDFKRAVSGLSQQEIDAIKCIIK